MTESRFADEDTLAHIAELEALVKQQVAVIEQMREALQYLTGHIDPHVKFIAEGALAIQPCPEVLNNVRAEAVRKFAVAMERAKAELPLPFAHDYAQRIEKGEA